MCPGDEVFQFAISSTGVRSSHIPSICQLVGQDDFSCEFRYRILEFRVVLHIRQTLSVTDDCPSELCFDTKKYRNITGNIAGDDGIACYDADKVLASGGKKWYVEPEDLEAQKWTLNGEPGRTILKGSDLLLLSDNTQSTGVCQRCDENRGNFGLDPAVLQTCPTHECRVCQVPDFVEPETAPYQTNAFVESMCSAYSGGAPIFNPSTGLPTGCPFSSDSTCPVLLDQYAPWPEDPIA